MTPNIGAALILGAALIAAAVLNGGVYSVSQNESRTFRLNRLTGAVDVRNAGYPFRPVREHEAEVVATQ